MTARIIQPSIDPQQRMRPVGFTRNCSRVKRQLFGEICHKDTSAFLAKELAEDQRLWSSKWNFDFDKGVPLPESPRYEWKKIAVTFAPQRLRKPQAELDIGDLYAPSLPEQVEEHKEEEVTKENDENHGAVIQGQQQQQRKTEQKQAKMTDFLPIRKRNISAKPETESVIPSKISKYNNC